jgi:spore coat protein U-like protein
MKALRLFFSIFLAVTSATAEAVTCTVSASTVAFGTYFPFAALPLDSTGNIRISCLPSGRAQVSYDIFLNSGLSGSYSPRKMFQGISPLNYNLYTDSTRTLIWGDGTAGTSIVSDSYQFGGISIRDYPVYGRLFPLQSVPVGPYSDTITVTVNY